MTEQKILQMIENVDPADTDKLDEIDARVWCYLKGYIYMHHGSDDGKYICFKKPKDCNERYECELVSDMAQEAFVRFPKYTRSRDALKAIRPEGFSEYFINYDYHVTGNGEALGYGWEATIEFTPKTKPLWVRCWEKLSKHNIPEENQVWFFNSKVLPTEELAELHAIIQAIAYERSQTND
jgi:hypothetical protein